jgi:hypothetical protein
LSFCAGAATMSHGRAEVVRVGRKTVLIGHPGQLRADIQVVLDERPSFDVPADFLRKHGDAALVFFILDGLSINGRDLVPMADVLAMMVTAYGADERRPQAAEYVAAQFLTKTARL